MPCEKEGGGATEEKKMEVEERRESAAVEPKADVEWRLQWIGLGRKKQSNGRSDGGVRQGTSLTNEAAQQAPAHSTGTKKQKQAPRCCFCGLKESFASQPWVHRVPDLLLKPLVAVAEEFDARASAHCQFLNQKATLAVEERKRVLEGKGLAQKLRKAEAAADAAAAEEAEINAESAALIAALPKSANLSS